jgi:hypothetical protein
MFHYMRSDVREFQLATVAKNNLAQFQVFRERAEIEWPRLYHISQLHEPADFKLVLPALCLRAEQKLLEVVRQLGRVRRRFTAPMHSAGL